MCSGEKVVLSRKWPTIFTLKYFSGVQGRIIRETQSKFRLGIQGPCEDQSVPPQDSGHPGTYREPQSQEFQS